MRDIFTELVIVQILLQGISIVLKVKPSISGFIIVKGLIYILILGLLYNFGIPENYSALFSGSLLLGLLLWSICFSNVYVNLKMRTGQEEQNVWTFYILLITCFLVFTLENNEYENIRHYWYFIIALVHTIFCVRIKKMALYGFQ